jgi:hypothetical protein
VSKGIIQTAITNKNLRLELTYHVPPTFPEGCTAKDEPAIDTAFAFEYDAEIASELVCLLSTIREERGEFA